MVGAALPATKMAKFLTRTRRDGGMECPMRNPKQSNWSGSSLSFSSSYYFLHCPFTNGCKKHILIWSSRIVRKTTGWKILFGMRSPGLMPKSTISTAQMQPKLHSQNALETGPYFSSMRGSLRLKNLDQMPKLLWYAQFPANISFRLKKILAFDLSNITASIVWTLRTDYNAQKN